MMEWTEPRLKRLPKAVMKIYEFAVKNGFGRPQIEGLLIAAAMKGALDNTGCRIKS